MSGSGTTELTMRGVDGTFLWNVYPPTQVIEFIHQLAASIGCNIQIQPREDFSSYREWNPVSDEEQVGLVKQNNSPGLSVVKDKEEDNVAKKKTIDK
jgi:hypothetical protein